MACALFSAIDPIMQCVTFCRCDNYSYVTPHLSVTMQMDDDSLDLLLTVEETADCLFSREH